MFTRKRLVLPTAQSAEVRALGKAISDYLLSLEAKDSLAIQATSIAAGQVAFPATQVPSTDPNTLDDYEEGTWTPADASGAGLTIGVTFAKYTKVGRIVHLAADINYPITASALAAMIGGAPFANSGIHTGSVITQTGNATVAQIAASVVTLNTAAAVQLTNVNLSGAVVRFTISYHT